MSFQSVLKSLEFSSARTRAGRARRLRVAKARLSVELLEDRCLLSNFTTGPLVQVSVTNPFADSTADHPATQPQTLFPDSEVEPYVVVDPTDCDHLVGIWQQDRWSGNGSRGVVVGVTFDGGRSWQEVVPPGLSQVAGGAFQRASDDWLSFAPNGDLYLSVLSFNPPAIAPASFGESTVMASKSTDGGLSWSNPVIVTDTTNALNDKEVITADPSNPNLAYLVWSPQTRLGVQGSAALFSRTTDGGQTWEPARVLYDAGPGTVNRPIQIVVEPDGTLVYFSTERRLSGLELTIQRSTDQGETWQGPIQISLMKTIGVTDPDKGGALRNGPIIYAATIDSNNGNLYAAWQDARFSQGQHDSIAFAMSTDDGLTWSQPIQINQTPTDIPAGDQQAWRPSIAVARNGTVAVTYYDFRFNDPSPGLATDYWFVRGDPHGQGGLTNPANWGDELRLTDSSFDLEKAPDVSGPFVGDYQGLNAVGTGFLALFAQPHGTDPDSIFSRRIKHGENEGGDAGSLVQVSSGDPFAGCTADDIAHQPGILTPSQETEPRLAVDPTDPDHLVGVFQQDRWSNGSARGLVAGVSFDGGQSWQEVVIPGLSLCSGGTFHRAADPEVSFAPNGDLYFSALVVDKGPSGLNARNAILASKSTDGGLTWTAPVTIDLQFPAETGRMGDDSPKSLADPTDPQLAYIVWRDEVQPSRWMEMFSRTTDGGRTWEPARILYDPGIGPRPTGSPLVVQPDGTLIDFLTATKPGGDPEFFLLRSSDRGQTWTPPIRIATEQPVRVTDPHTGQLVTSNPSDDVAGDPSNGNLYAVWEDGRFNGRQHDAVVFSMSTDGGLTWSEPIQINQTPTDIAPGNQQAFLPQIQVAEDGTVGVTYYDFRFNDPLPGLATDYWFVHAHPDDPGGLTNPANWAHELRLTNSSFDLERAQHSARGLFLGDYQGLAVAGNNFLPFWAQPGETDPSNIFFRRIEQGDEHQHHDESDDDPQHGNGQHRGDGHEEDHGHGRSRSASLDLTGLLSGSNGASDRVEALRLLATWTDQSTAPASAVETLSRQSGPLPPGAIAVDEFYATEVTSRASGNKLTAKVGCNLFFGKSDLDLTDWEALPETFVML